MAADVWGRRSQRRAAKTHQATEGALYALEAVAPTG